MKMAMLAHTFTSAKPRAATYTTGATAYCLVTARSVCGEASGSSRCPPRRAQNQRAL